MSLRKRFLTSSVARVGVGLFVKLYRAFMCAGFLVRHDRATLSLMRAREPVVLLCWHQDFFITLGLLSRAFPRRPTHALASMSRDGGLAAAAAEGVGYAPTVRGSSMGGGASALRRMGRLARSDRRPSFAVVGDGPRPPARVLKPGAIRLAGDSGLPIWLVRSSWHPDASMRRTWARFHSPGLFSRAVALAEGPIHVPPGLDREATERLRAEVERRLEALAARSDAVAARIWGTSPAARTQAETRSGVAATSAETGPAAGSVPPPP